MITKMRDTGEIVCLLFTTNFNESLNCALHLWSSLTISSIMSGEGDIKFQPKPKGKSSGTKNFQPIEDLNITIAYKKVTFRCCSGN